MLDTSLCNTSKNLIADDVPMFVVDFFEMVDIEQKE